MIKRSFIYCVYALSATLLFSACSAQPIEYTEPLTPGVSAKVIDVDAPDKTLLVAGLDEDSILGNQCYVSGYSDGVIVLQLEENAYTQTSFNDIVEGDVVTLTLHGGVDDSFPSHAVAAEITINPVTTNPSANPLLLWPYNIEKLTDDAPLEQMLELLNYSDDAPITSFTVSPGEFSSLTIEFDADFSYADAVDLTPYDQNAVVLYALIDDLEELVYVFGDFEIPYSRKWAQSIVSPTFVSELENAEDFGSLLNVLFETTSADDDFYTVDIFDITTSNASRTELYSTNRRSAAYDVRDLLVTDTELVSKSSGEPPSDVSHYILISFATLDLSTTILEDYYLYERNGVHYLELSGEGIWEVESSLMESFLVLGIE